MTFKQTNWLLWQLLLPDRYEIDENYIVLKIRKWFKPMNQDTTISYRNIASVEANKAGRFGIRGYILNYGNIIIRTNSEYYELRCVSNYKVCAELIQEKIKNANGQGHSETTYSF